MPTLIYESTHITPQKNKSAELLKGVVFLSLKKSTPNQESRLAKIGPNGKVKSNRHHTANPIDLRPLKKLFQKICA